MSELEAKRKALRPQPFNFDQIKRLVFVLFRLEVIKCTELDSYDDKNYLLTTTSPYEQQQQFVLKIHNGADERDFPLAQSKALQHLTSQHITCPVDFMPPVCLQDHVVRLLCYVPGTLMCDHVAACKSESVLNAMYFKFGTFLANVDIALRNSTLVEQHPVLAARKLQWDLRYFSQLSYFVDNNPQLTAKQIDQCKNTLQEFNAMDTCKFTLALVHNDANDHNVLLVNNEESFAILDFGDTVYTWLVSEVSIAMAYVLVGYFSTLSEEEEDHDDVWLQRVAYLFRGYQQQQTLSNEETQAIYTLIKARLTTSACLGAYSASLHPENATYLLLHSQPAWRALEAMQRVGHKNFMSNGTL